MMKQVQLAKPGGLDNLLYVDAKVPKSKDYEVIVKVGASSLNYHDLLVAQGGIPTRDRRVPLSDCGGVIYQVGESVSKWKEGDSVISCSYPFWTNGPPKASLMKFIGDNLDGYATEYIAVPETSLTRAPKNWSHEEAATLPCAGLTAWVALVEFGKLKAGEIVLVQGTGGVSIFALQLAKAMGAKVIATSSSEQKLKRLRELGADEVINYKTTPNWGREVLKRTNNDGVDHVIEVGGGETFGESVRCTKLGGHIALIGVLSGPAASQIILPHIFLKQIRLSGIAMGNHQHQKNMIEFLDQSSIRPIISDRFPLNKLSEAFQHQIDNNHFGKISIIVDNNLCSL
mmetsp:Transcript_19459/g.23669  ORF Transcript_19459/g.23669 Transcript_19459/m.23669 type:complete len:343 (+) Transcript_19459:90-1118(+)